MVDSNVDFLIVGAQKCGTTALAHYLRQHPEIYVAGANSGQRSLHYFDRECNFEREAPDYSTYHRQFDPGPDVLVTGESTPAYIFWNAAPGRIWEYNPDIKLIAVLRNPITRAFSNWNMESQRGNEALDFHSACLEERARGFAALPSQDLVNAYIARGYYSHQVRRLQQFFPDEQLLFIKYEQLRQQPLTTINKTCQFLGVDVITDLQPASIHRRDYQRKLSQQEFQYLKSTFENDIKDLERLLGWDCSGWLDYPED